MTDRSGGQPAPLEVEFRHDVDASCWMLATKASHPTPSGRSCRWYTQRVIARSRQARPAGVICFRGSGSAAA